MKWLLTCSLILFNSSLFAQEGWTSVFIEADSSKIPFEILDTIYVPLYPDSNIVNGVNEFKGCPIEKQHNIHGIGQSFDFDKHNWVSVEFDEWAVSTDIDSIIFKYHYHRTSSYEVVDTIIAQITRVVYNSDSSVSVATNKNGMSLKPIQTMKIPLSEADSTLFNENGRFIVVALNEPQHSRNWAITVTFRSGSDNDSLVAKIQDNSSNIFALESYAVKSSYYPSINYNNGLLLTTESKNDSNSQYNRSNFKLENSSVELYPVFYFKYNLTYRNINENKENGLKIIPTIINSGEKITIKAKGLENASIFDLNGKLLHSSASNQISTTELTKGVFLLKIDTKNPSVTRRIVVN